MKKVIALLLAVIMVFSLTACKSDKKEEVSSAAPAPTTVGTKLAAEFKKQLAANPEITPEALGQALVTNEIIEFMGMAMPVSEGQLTGFKAEIKGFKEGAVFAPGISVIPFVGYIFKLDDGADVNAFMQTLKDNADMRWNICTEAEEMVVENVGNTVFFIMCPKSFEESPAEGGDVEFGEPVANEPLGEPAADGELIAG